MRPGRRAAASAHFAAMAIFSAFLQAAADFGHGYRENAKARLDLVGVDERWKEPWWPSEGR